MFLRAFFRPSKTSTSMHPKDWLNQQFKTSGLEERFPAPLRTQTQETAKVFFNQRYFNDNNPQAPFSLYRALSKIPAINVSGDRSGFFQNGTPFPEDPDYFANIPLAHPELLSPVERLSAAKKIIFSNSTVFASGGYPHMNPRYLKKEPHTVGIFSLAGASFENSYLHYSLFMLDPINSKIDNPRFDHLFESSPTDFNEAHTSLGPYDSNAFITRIRTGLPLLSRSAPDKFYSAFSRRNAVIFLSQAYYQHQLEDLSMLLTAVNKAAEEAGKPALLKATAVGMGFFAKVNETYDIQHLLFPHFIRAFKQLVETNSYPWIAKIEFPIFDEQLQLQFNAIIDKPVEPVELYQNARDVLDFSNEEVENYYVCCINPSDAFAYSGNEWGFGSVEAMIGLNSSLRLDQIPVENPLLLEPSHQVPVNIKSSFEAELLDFKSSGLQM
ncbi:type IV secretion protein Dot [Fluoribacter dumoffii]|uniref:hypothetical protein n=1 Tax=Fluoribacter dumoffii TaxID=463 RepID=UPI00026C81BB|nr:hypothetical protein [Fluoribacter dumoffii]MCW8417029.1 type IV secretion protein Dot [Fluoribacter dumoffii]MCW8455131.1 type IV secretion protein Dot [Fluoribacter dumoffii]MCW8460792.1 type IV secretion protein Dot [Fluoribacter dumoffii]MCW8484234.1 type IV secretion protein Dot [Fluoribacter dumoffii]